MQELGDSRRKILPETHAAHSKPNLLVSTWSGGHVRIFDRLVRFAVKQRFPPMSTAYLRRSERRRTPRVAIFANLTVEGHTGNEKFKVHTRSLSVSGHGGLTMLD